MFKAAVRDRGNAILLRILVLSSSLVARAVSMSTLKPFCSKSTGKDSSRRDLHSKPRIGRTRPSAPAKPSVSTCASWLPSVAATSNKKDLELRSSTSEWHALEETIRNRKPIFNMFPPTIRRTEHADVLCDSWFSHDISSNWIQKQTPPAWKSVKNYQKLSARLR